HRRAPGSTLFPYTTLFRSGEQIVVAVEVTNTGSDRGLLRPMLQQLRVRTGHFPGRHLADGGFGSAQDIEWAHGEGIAVYCPPTQDRKSTRLNSSHVSISYA